jgi:hypothetical protein
MNVTRPTRHRRRREAKPRQVQHQVQPPPEMSAILRAIRRGRGVSAALDAAEQMIIVCAEIIGRVHGPQRASAALIAAGAAMLLHDQERDDIAG